MQVGTLADSTRALERLRELRALGYPAYGLVSEKGTRIRIGYFARRDQAESFGKRFSTRAGRPVLGGPPRQGEREPPMSARRRVMCCGTFDHFHPGHDFFLHQAARLGEELFVVVARDANVLRIKGQAPDQGEDERLGQVARQEAVDDARLGYPGSDFLRVVADIDPQVIALGYDQKAPPGLAQAFPACRIVTLEAFEPERYKSSLMRDAAGGSRPSAARGGA